VGPCIAAGSCVGLCTAAGSCVGPSASDCMQLRISDASC